jgi:RsiW-degrading membrane proteinase PrsW (M82 family)
MTSSWSAVPLGISALMVAFACLGSLLLVDGWYGLNDNDLPDGLRGVLTSFLGFRSQRAQRPTAVRVVLALIFFGGLIAFCLSIPLRFLADPAWVKFNGVNGHVSGLVCLGGFVTWLL